LVRRSVDRGARFPDSLPTLFHFSNGGAPIARMRKAIEQDRPFWSAAIHHRFFSPANPEPGGSSPVS
jgi:hypothetical protein